MRTIMRARRTFVNSVRGLAAGVSVGTTTGRTPDAARGGGDCRFRVQYKAQPAFAWHGSIFLLYFPAYAVIDIKLSIHGKGGTRAVLESAAESAGRGHY